MKTAKITYFGSGTLSLQNRRFQPGRTVNARLDDILPPERERYRSWFLIVGNDDRLINVGAFVPRARAQEAVETNGFIDSQPGFEVVPPPGFGLQDDAFEPRIVSASAMVEEAGEPVAVAVEEPAPVEEPKKAAKGRKSKKAKADKADPKDEILNDVF